MTFRYNLLLAPALTQIRSDEIATPIRARDEDCALGRFNGDRIIQELTTDHWIGVPHEPARRSLLTAISPAIRRKD